MFYIYPHISAHIHAYSCTSTYIHAYPRKSTISTHVQVYPACASPLTCANMLHTHTHTHCIDLTSSRPVALYVSHLQSTSSTSQQLPACNRQLSMFQDSRIWAGGMGPKVLNIHVYVCISLSLSLSITLRLMLPSKYTSVCECAYAQICSIGF